MPKKMYHIVTSVVFSLLLTGVFASEMVIHFIDVDWGDSIFIETPCEKYILIDGGWNDERGEKTVDYIKNLGVEKIDKAIATHQHADHIGGLILVYEDEDLEVDVTYDSGFDHNTITAERYRNLAHQHSEFKIARAFDTLDLEYEDLTMTFIHPYEGAEGPIHYLNLVLKIEYKDFSALLTGDADKYVEAVLLDNSETVQYLPSDILKAGHHGHNDASSDDFLSVVSPEIAFVPTPDSDTFPRDEAMDRLYNAGIKILRADQVGTTVITTDGSTYTVAYPELPVAENISDLRDTAGTGSIYWLESEAVITLQGSFRNQRFIQDSSGGIIIDDNEGIFYTTYQTGDAVQGLIGLVTEYHGMLQFIPYIDSGIVLSSGNTVDPPSLKISELTSGHQGVLVKIGNVTFKGQEGTIFHAGRNYTFEDENGREIVLRTIFSEPDYIGEPVPMEPINIIGVHNVYNATPQIIPRSMNDLEPVITGKEYDAVLESYDVPEQMYLNRHDTISLTFRNTGIQKWEQGTNVYLGAVGDQDDLAPAHYWRVGLHHDVDHLEEHTFTIEAYPQNSGVFTTQWQMLKEGEFWFGEMFSEEVTVIERTYIEDTLWHLFQ